MTNSLQNSSWKPAFCNKVRELRVMRNLKQREVAEAIGIKTNTYGNVESSPHVVISETAVRRLARFHQLGIDDTEALLAMWKELPIRESTKQTREMWARKNAIRNAVKRVPQLELACGSLAALLLTLLPDQAVASLCVCDFGGDSAACEFCEALAAIGLPPFDTKDQTIGRIAALQAKHERAAAEPAGA
jgi:transcriptional regulator with XRE-family HTH domain